MFGLNFKRFTNQSTGRSVSASVDEAVRKARYGNGLHFGQTIRPLDAARFAIAYRCITLIAGSMARLPVYLEHADGHIIEDYKQLPLADRRIAKLLLTGERISGLYYMSDLVKQQATDLALYGNTFLERTPFGFEYHPPAGAISEVSRSADGSLFSTLQLQRLADDTQGLTSYNARDILHARLPSLTAVTDTSGMLGTAPLHAISDSIESISLVDEFVHAYFESGGFGNQAMIAYPNKVDNEVALEVEARLHRKSDGGIRRMFNILGSGAKVTALNTDTQSSEMVKLRERLVEEVARAYGVPGSLVGIKSTEVGTGLEELTKSFVRFSLMQYREALENAYSNTLFSDGVKFKFDTATFTAGDLSSLSSFITATVGDAQRSPVLSIKELRRLLDVPLDVEIPVSPVIQSEQETTETTETDSEPDE